MATDIPDSEVNATTEHVIALKYGVALAIIILMKEIWFTKLYIITGMHSIMLLLWAFC